MNLNRSLNCFLMIGLLGSSLIGCGSGGSYVPSSSQPIIIKQPISEQVPLGLSGSFSVEASGSDLEYAWQKNGIAIEGATGQEYVTPPVQASDEGDSFTVMISNPAGALASGPAILTVGARAPKVGDLRFQSVDAPYVVNGSTGQLASFLLIGNSGTSYPDAIGSPLQLGSGLCSSEVLVGCSWAYIISAPNAGIAGVASTYVAGDYADLQDELSLLRVPNTVISSLDIEESSGEYGLATQSTSVSSGFDMSEHLVDLVDLQADATREGANGRVITAVSSEGGQVLYLSYGWQGDSTDTYDTSVVQTTLSNITAAAANLAADGYIITAVGGNGSGGMIVIGARVTGDSSPREFLFAQSGGATPNVGVSLGMISSEGYSIVGYIFDETSETTTWLAER